MKRILTILFLIIGFWGYSQTPAGHIKLNSKYNWISGAFDSTIYPPVRDTNFTPSRIGALTLRPQDSLYYGFTGYPQRWVRLGAGGSGVVDSLIFATRLRLYKVVDSLLALLITFTFDNPNGPSDYDTLATYPGGNTQQLKRIKFEGNSIIPVTRLATGDSALKWSFTINRKNLGSNTPSSGMFLAWDSTWRVPAGGTSGIDNQFLIEQVADYRTIGRGFIHASVGNVALSLKANGAATFDIFDAADNNVVNIGPLGVYTHYHASTGVGEGFRMWGSSDMGKYMQVSNSSTGSSAYSGLVFDNDTKTGYLRVHSPNYATEPDEVVLGTDNTNVTIKAVNTAKTIKFKIGTTDRFIISNTSLASSFFATAGTKVLTADASGVLGAVADGTNGQVLTRVAGVPAWAAPSGGGSGWSLTGDAGTSPPTNFIGTTDGVDFVAKTSALERLRIKSYGNVQSLGKLHFTSPNALNHIINFSDDDTANYFIREDTTAARLQIKSPAMLITTTTGDLYIQNDLGVYAVFASSGKVGFGAVWSPAAKVDIDGDLKIGTIANEATDVDKFLVSNGGIVKYRTGAEVLSDIGGGSGSGTLAVIDDINYTVAAGVTDVVYKTMSTGRTVTLPAASSNTNRKITIKNGGAGAFNITLSTAVRENSTTTTSTIIQSFWMTIMSDGTEWWIVAMK